MDFHRLPGFRLRCNDFISAPKAKQSYKQKHTIPLLTVHFYHVKRKICCHLNQRIRFKNTLHLSTTFSITSRHLGGLGPFPPRKQSPKDSLSKAGKVAQLKGVAVIIQLVGSPSADLFCWLVVIHYVNQTLRYLRTKSFRHHHPSSLGSIILRRRQVEFGIRICQKM